MVFSYGVFLHARKLIGVYELNLIFELDFYKSIGHEESVETSWRPH